MTFWDLAKLLEYFLKYHDQGLVIAQHQPILITRHILICTDVYVRQQAVQIESQMSEPKREQELPIPGNSYLSSSDPFYQPLDLEEESNLYKKTY